MEISLVRAGITDAEVIWKMQLEAFAPYLERYRDFETNPANEPLEKVVRRLNQAETFYYLIRSDERTVGAIRVIDRNDGGYKRIGPFFVLSPYRNRGIGQRAIRIAEEIHGAARWELDTILEETGNCYLYEKIGYRRIGTPVVVNARMTLVNYRKD